VKRKRPKRLSPYRRLERELANSREALASAVNEYTKVLAGLMLLLKRYDELLAGKSTWTHADAQEMAALRELTRLRP